METWMYCERDDHAWKVEDDGPDCPLCSPFWRDAEPEEIPEALTDMAVR